LAKTTKVLEIHKRHRTSNLLIVNIGTSGGSNLHIGGTRNHEELIAGTTRQFSQLTSANAEPASSVSLPDGPPVSGRRGASTSCCADGKSLLVGPKSWMHQR
jgi:hypothetical protein